MSPSIVNDAPAAPSASVRQRAVEAALVFVVFFLQGAWPVPEVNEPCYLGGAIRFWNPDWAAGDFFLDSAQTHQLFCVAFGWLSLWLTPDAFAWAVRVLTWGLLAWSWQRLSFAVVPRRWLSVLTAALFVCLQERCQMAGEWVVGGAEAKGFAYVLVFLGLEALVRGRWNRTWLLFGAAGALHVLVGGWSVVAAGFAWAVSGRDRPRLAAMAPALLGGFVLSLPGLVPAMMLNWNATDEVIRQANDVYVFGRLAHHLVPAYFPMQYVARFLALLVGLAVLDRLAPLDEGRRRLRLFTAGAIAVALCGTAINLLEWADHALPARLLRFYWFRLSDAVVPIAVALFAASYIAGAWAVRPRLARAALVVAIVAAGCHVGWYAVTRPLPTVPRADRLPRYVHWRLACDWIAAEGNVPKNARFITPAMNQTFKWYAGRPEVVNWKEVPQDGESIVRWWHRMHDVHYTGNNEPGERWHVSPAAVGATRLRQLGRRYDADYVITLWWPRRLDLPIVYWNRSYVIYRLGDEGP